MNSSLNPVRWEISSVVCKLNHITLYGVDWNTYRVVATPPLAEQAAVMTAACSAEQINPFGYNNYNEFCKNQWAT